MDCVNGLTSPKVFRMMAVFFVVLAITWIMIDKAVDEGWFIPKKPLDLTNAPVLVFFNRHKGCECEMMVYKAAEKQIAEWSDEDRRGIPIIPIDLDRRPDLGKQFDIIRAPALLLIDSEGKILFKQQDTVLDTAPLDLDAFQRVMEEVKNGN